MQTATKNKLHDNGPAEIGIMDAHSAQGARASPYQCDGKLTNGLPNTTLWSGKEKAQEWLL
jgi:hypothetical protein